MNGYFVAFLVGLAACARQPATIRLSGDGDAVVYTLDPITLPETTVLDANGAALSPAPVVAWTVDNPAVAKVDLATGNLVPTGEGTAVVTAAAGKAVAAWQVQVYLPDAVTLTGASDGQTVPVGRALALEATSTHAGQFIPSLPVTWATSDPTLATVTDVSVDPLAPGKVTITATYDKLERAVQIEVVPAAATTDAEREAVSADI